MNILFDHPPIACSCYTCGRTLWQEDGACPRAVLICGECRRSTKPERCGDGVFRLRLDIARRAMEQHLAEHRAAGDFDGLWGAE